MTLTAAGFSAHVEPRVKVERPRCLNCNKTLRAEMRLVEREATADEIERYREFQAEREAAFRKFDRAVTDKDYNEARDESQRLDRKRIARVYKNAAGKQMVMFSEPTGKFGQGGLGLFCKRACGERFGIAAARAGYRRRK